MAELEKNKSEAAVEVATEVKETEKSVGKKEKSKKATPKKNKIGLGQRISKFFKDYKSELKKIVWLSPKTTAQYTGVVLIMMVVVSAFIFALDTVFGQLLLLISKLV
ncbi:MAG: preprotein translocase subunit SecE [Clostridia bacterium]|nr:preprotein translocase subunit SecE [Clostridia bacterium]